MALLTLKDIHLTYGERHLLRGVSLVVGERDRVGLLGPNGCGKSTLLGILAAEVVPDDGERTERRGLRIGYLAQDPPVAPELTVRDAVAQGLVGRDEVLAALDAVHERMATAGAAALERLCREQERLEQRLEALGGHDVEHRVDAMMSHLGLQRPDARCGALSGGERRRTALASTLLARPDLLLLDEPTNHLDARVTEWLEDWLLANDLPLVMVTHDRYFLDRVVDRIVEVDHGVLHGYEGGYGEFLVGRAERLEREQRTESSRLNLLRREAEWMRRGPPARSTKAKARIGRFHALADAAPDAAADELAFRIPDGPRLGDRVLRLEGVTKGFGDRTLLRALDLELGPGTRLGIAGPNGAGKSTFLSICQGRLPPDDGVVVVGPTVRFAGIDQQRSGLDPSKTVLAEVGGDNDFVMVGGQTLRIEGFLTRFLFPGPMMHLRIAELSGGERNRVLLAKLLALGGNVLLLDEPTNDLDLMTLRVLEEALIAFAGAVLVVSHDRAFLDRIATRVLYLDGDGGARVHEGDLSDLLRRLDGEAVAAAAAVARAGANKPRAKPATAPAPRLSSRERRELAELPARIEAVEDALAATDARLADPGLYREEDSAREVERLTAERHRLRAELDALYLEWERLEQIASAVEPRPT